MWPYAMSDHTLDNLDTHPADHTPEVYPKPEAIRAGLAEALAQYDKDGRSATYSRSELFMYSQSHVTICQVHELLAMRSRLIVHKRRPSTMEHRHRTRHEFGSGFRRAEPSRG